MDWKTGDGAPVVGDVSPRGSDATASGEAPIWGYDVLRSVAMAVVVSRHLLSVSGLENVSASIPRCLGIGVFSALSGYLALRSRGGDPLPWLRRRLRKIYGPYWIALAAMFALNALGKYKPTTLGLVVSQFLGLAYFTHRGEDLVGVHTWFISLILVCYVMAALLRRETRLLPLLLALALSGLRLDRDFVGCILAFLAGASLALSPRFWAVAIAMAGASLAATPVLGWGLTFPLAGTLALMIGAPLRGARPRLCALASRNTYAFFLVHGPVYLILTRVVGFGFVANVVLGTPLVFLVAWALGRASHAFDVRLGDVSGWLGSENRCTGAPSERDGGESERTPGIVGP